jgi:hypothetical protein
MRNNIRKFHFQTKEEECFSANMMQHVLIFSSHILILYYHLSIHSIFIFNFKQLFQGFFSKFLNNQEGIFPKHIILIYKFSALFSPYGAIKDNVIANDISLGKFATRVMSFLRDFSFNLYVLITRNSTVIL